MRKRIVKDLMNCKNRVCFCIEYLNFSKPNHFKIYNECYKIKRENSNNIVCPQMKKYLINPVNL